MANVSITSSSIFPTSITVEETGKTITLTDNTAVSKNIVVDQLTVTESPAALNDISDVEITSIADDQILVYDSTSGKWKNEANAAGGGAVDSVNGQVGVVVLDTDDISEGTNKYYADSLVDAHLVGGTGVTYSAGNISIGQDVATTANPTFNTVTATDEFLGDLDGSIQTTIRNTSGSTIYKGQAVYVTGLSGDTPTVSLARADSASTMPAAGIARADINNNASGQMTIVGALQGIDASASNNLETGITLAVNDVLYVSATEAGNITNVTPAGESNLIQNLGKAIRVSPNTNMTFSVKGAGRTNATPNLNDGNIFIGDATNHAITSSLDTEVSALGYLKNIVEDTTPELGANLDAVSTYKIVNLVDPTSNQDAATKAYVDSSGASGISAVVDDTTPQLGGNLDVLGQNIFSSTSIVKVNDGLQIMAGNSLRFENSAQTQNVTLSGTLTTTGYDLKLPTTAPAASQYLTVDAAGQLTFSNIPTVITNNNQLTNGAGYITASSSDALTNKTGNISQWTNDSNYLLNVIEDTTPQLGGTLDPNGNNIDDSTRLYVIVGNNNAPSKDDYDSMSGGTAGQRVRGPITIGESSGGTDRFHGNPRLNLHTLTADRTDGNARFRMNYVEGVLDTAGFDTTQTGFGRGHHGMFLSGKVRNSGASASTVNQVRAITMSPQLDGLTSNVTVDDMRACEVRPFINSGGTVNNMYGVHYSTSGGGTVTNQYSFYGAEAGASAYNAGGFQLPIVTVANLSTLPQREGNTAYVNNNTAGTGSVAKCMVFYDGSNWKLAHEPGTTAA